MYLITIYVQIAKASKQAKIHFRSFLKLVINPFFLSDLFHKQVEYAYWYPHTSFQLKLILVSCEKKYNGIV